MCIRDHSAYGLGRWETTLPYNVAFKWLSPYPECALCIQTVNNVYFATWKISQDTLVPILIFYLICQSIRMYDSVASASCFCRSCFLSGNIPASTKQLMMTRVVPNAAAMLFATKFGESSVCVPAAYHNFIKWQIVLVTKDSLDTKWWVGI